MLVCAYLMQLLCPHLGLTASAFRGIADTPSQMPSSSSLDVIQYLPVAEAVPSCKPEGLCALHHDMGLLTLIWSDTVEGPQVTSMLPFQPYKDVAINICSAATMPECLLYVLVIACKPVRCRFSACIEFIGCTAGSPHQD